MSLVPSCLPPECQLPSRELALSATCASDPIRLESMLVRRRRVYET
jgi:hypothetical protein